MNLNNNKSLWKMLFVQRDKKLGKRTRALTEIIRISKKNVLLMAYWEMCLIYTKENKLQYSKYGVASLLIIRY